MRGSPLHIAVSDAFQRSRPSVLRYLHRRFSTTPREQIEDAVGQAALSLLEQAADPTSATVRAWQTGGAPSLERLLCKVSWRNLRGDHRRLRNRRECCAAEPPEPAHVDSPLALLEAVEMQRHIERLMPRAGRRFGASASGRLREALQARLGSAETDLEVARRYEVGRSQLCRARGWLEREILA